MPVYRQKKLAAEAAHQAEVAQKAPFLGKWLWLLFCLVIPAIIAGIMKNDVVVSWLPVLNWPGQLLHLLCLLAYGLILLKLSSESEHYRTAGIYSLISSGINVVVTVISGGGEAPNWTLIFSLPALVVALISEYREYMGHEEVLTGVDGVFADKWRLLWKWYIGVFAAMFGSIVVALLSPGLGTLVLVAALIANVVISIVKLVYLYRMARLFREITEE